MEQTIETSLSAIAAKETWTAEDHKQLLGLLFNEHDAPRKFAALLSEIEAANPTPKGAAALKVGIARFMACRFKGALEVFSAATDNKDRRYFQALSHKAMRAYPKAIEEMEYARERGWDAADADLQLAELRALNGELDLAEKMLNKLENKVGQTADFLYVRGLVRELQGNTVQAAELYEKAIGINPEHAGATFHLAYYYDLHGFEEEAVELYKKCISHPPIYGNALLNLAVLYEDLGKNELSIACLERVLVNEPNHPRAKLFLKDANASKSMYYDEEQAKRQARRNAVMDIPVTDFELSVRARNCLKKMNIRTLGDLVRTSEAELLGYKNFGETSLKEIKDMLSAKGLRLGQGTEDLDLVPMPTKPAAAAAPQPAVPAANEGVMGTPVEQVEFSIRVRRALQALKINTLGDLANRSEPELLGCKNFGQTSLNEVRQRLAAYGLKFREQS